MKKRKHKVSSKLGILFLLVSLPLSGWLAFQGINDVQTFINLKSEVKANEELLDATKAEQEKLEATKKNLTNPDYLELVARGKYHVLREGEQVFVFPSLSETQNDRVSDNEASTSLAQSQAAAPSTPASKAASESAQSGQ
ncbi:septum formation initiator family protein [Erysipelotrichaceae bacterium 51-3]|uniref:FtsB family cell division protein n=1 Tax=Allobaculum sp. JKK-2023 TaxID=3108943 RepID=UPI002B055631|nr:septum formation initiator family protein [Allobaculum sp. JKK-2023]